MSVVTIKSLMEKRKDAYAEALDIQAKQEREKRSLTDEEKGKVSEIFDSIDAITADIERIERQLKIEAMMAENEKTDAQKRNNDKKDAPVEYKDAFVAWFRSGGDFSKMTPDQVKALKAGEKRAQSAGTGSEGGFTVPEGFSGQLEKYMAIYGGMFEAGRIWRTASGNAIPWPTVNDISNTGGLVSENAQEGEQDVTFAEVTFNAYKYGSDIVRVSYELLNDSFFNMETVLRDLFAERLGRGMNALLTTGTGSSQPNGVVTAGASGLTAAAVAAVTRAELVQLVHSVDPAYRRGPKSGWMFNDSTLSAIKQLGIGASDARPLWQPSMSASEPDRLDGYQYFINQDVADLAASSKSILFGDFDKYIIRLVGDVRFRQSEHLYFDYDQTAFVAFQRLDGDLIASGANGAIKFITQAAS